MDEVKMKAAFAARLKEACDALELPRKGRGKMIAEALGVSERTVSKWVLGDSMPQQIHLYSLADFLKVSKEWLAFGSENVEKTTSKERLYPVFSYVQAGRWIETNSLTDEQGEIRMLSSHVLASDKSYHLVVKGDSMKGEFEEGDIILVDPERSPIPGEFVVAVNEHYEVTLKMYRQLSELTENGEHHFELVPKNDKYPVLSSKVQNIKIVGVVAAKTHTY